MALTSGLADLPDHLPTRPGEEPADLPGTESRAARLTDCSQDRPTHPVSRVGLGIQLNRRDDQAGTDCRAGEKAGQQAFHSLWWQVDEKALADE